MVASTRGKPIYIASRILLLLLCFALLCCHAACMLTFASSSYFDFDLLFSRSQRDEETSSSVGVGGCCCCRPPPSPPHLQRRRTSTTNDNPVPTHNSLPGNAQSPGLQQQQQRQQHYCDMSRRFINDRNPRATELSKRIQYLIPQRHQCLYSLSKSRSYSSTFSFPAD